jgi:hypothetical protein
MASAPRFSVGDRIVYHDPEIPFLDFPGVVVEAPGTGADPTVKVRLDDPLPARPDVLDARVQDVHSPTTRCEHCAPSP